MDNDALDFVDQLKRAVVAILDGLRRLAPAPIQDGVSRGDPRRGRGVFRAHDADKDIDCGSGMAAHARRRQAGLRAVSNDRCLAPGCRRTVTWIEDLADGGVTSW